MRKLVLCLLVFALPLFAHIIARAQDEVVIPPKSASLPRAFSRFSASAVLKQIFENYDAATGRAATILNEDGKPALVRINEDGGARRVASRREVWRFDGQEFNLVRQTSYGPRSMSKSFGLLNSKRADRAPAPR